MPPRAKQALTAAKAKASSKPSSKASARDVVMPKTKAGKKGTRGDGGKRKKGIAYTTPNPTFPFVVTDSSPRS